MHGGSPLLQREISVLVDSTTRARDLDRLSVRPPGSVHGHWRAPRRRARPAWVRCGRLLRPLARLPLTSGRPRLHALDESAQHTPTWRTECGTLSFRWHSATESYFSTMCENIMLPLVGKSATWIVPVSASVM